MDASEFTSRSPGTLVRTDFNSVAFVPHALAPDLSLTLSSEIRSANEAALLALGELRAIIPSLPNPKLITQPFLRREAVASSKIEGTHTELEGLYLFEARAAERKTRTGSGEDDDAHEVHNYVLSLEHGLEQLSAVPVCNRLLRSMHEKLFDGVSRERGLFKSPGAFRRRLAYIGSGEIETARYVAPPPELVEPLMADLERYINSDSGQPTLVDLALIHYQFETIHPFADGNGRLGRLLLTLLLSARQILPEPLLYLSAYFERHRAEYVQCLWRVNCAGEWEEWIHFFIQGVQSEAVDATKRASTILRLREEYRSMFQSNKRGAYCLFELIDYLFRWPALTVPRAAEHLNVSYQGAMRNVKTLEEAGIIEEVTGFSRNRIYLAKPIIQLMS